MAFISGYVHFGIGLSPFLSVLEVFSSFKEKKLSPLFFLGISLSLLQFQLLAFLSGSYKENPHLMTFFIGNLSVLAPLLYWQGKKMVEFGLQEEDKSLPRQFIIPGLIVIMEIIFSIFPAEKKREILITSLAELRMDVINIAIISICIVLLIYFIHFMYRFYELKEDISLNYPEPVFRMIIFGFIILFTFLIGFVIRSGILLWAGLVELSALLMFVFIYRELYPNFFETLKKEILARKYEKTQLKGINVDAIRERISELMLEEKIYRDDELKLPKLAEELLITPNQLSRILNEHFRKNFNDFINFYRIEEAKKLLLEDRRTTILAIAYDVGFSAKSTFNTYFVQATGMTPSEFRKKGESKT